MTSPEFDTTAQRAQLGSRTALGVWPLVVFALAVASGGVAAQTGNAVDGRSLYLNPIPPSAESCSGCHGAVEFRRDIFGGPLADISVDDAQAAFNAAIAQNLGGVMGRFSSLNGQTRADISAYLADTPKVSPSLLQFSVADSTSPAATAQTVTLSASVAAIPATTQLTVVSVIITGANAGDFNLTAQTCQGMTLALGQSCTVSVNFDPFAVGSKSAELLFSLEHRESVGDPSTMITRTVALKGSVGAGLNPNPNGDGGGGGMLDLAALAALAAALVGLVAARRNA